MLYVFEKKNESCYSQKSCLLYSILYKLPMLFTKWNFVHRKTDLEIQNKANKEVFFFFEKLKDLMEDCSLQILHRDLCMNINCSRTF